MAIFSKTLCFTQTGINVEKLPY